MPLFGRKKRPISDHDRSFVEETIQRSKFAKLKGRRRERKIQKLADELRMNVITMNVRSLSPEKQEEYRQLALTPNNYTQVEEFLERNIPDYIEKQTQVLVDFATKYEKK